MTLWRCVCGAIFSTITEAPAADYCPHCGEATIEEYQHANWSWEKG